jgi:membrane-bound lytic murein transglycosylase D
VPLSLPTLRMLFGAALCLSGPASVARAAEPTGQETEAPAQGEPEPSIWSYIEGAESAPPTAATLAATQELAAERLAELSRSGLVGALPPVDYYLDPVAATDGDPLHLERVDPREFDIPVVVNDEVVGWMRYFLGNGRKYYHRYLERSTRWMPMMHRELAARGLPRDLVYLSMIESGFNVGATSFASAAGLWQFMTYTGRDYGLRIDWWVDERRDPELATKAALRYLGDLNRMFSGDWWLSWASYNGGQGRVMKASRLAGTTDFWAIARGRWLHPETDNYVPKLIAAAIIGKHPERYGFVGLTYQPEFTHDSVSVPASSNVAVLARCAGLSTEAFLDYNPALRRLALPPDPATQRVRIPRGTSATFEAALAAVPEEERITRLQRHVVRRGQSLAGIARAHGVPVEELARVNRLPTRGRLRVGTELVVPVSGTIGPAEASTPPPAAASESAAARAGTGNESPRGAAEAPARTTYVVKSGDTLGAIAARNGVTVAQVQSWNGMKGTVVKVGQRLVVRAPETRERASVQADPARAKGKSGARTRTVVVQVRRGDTLGSIAERYDCTIAELKAWNGLRGSTIYVGQKLRIKD